MSLNSSANNSTDAGHSNTAGGFKSTFSEEQMAMAKLLKKEQNSSGGKNSGMFLRDGRGTGGHGGTHSQQRPPHHPLFATTTTSGRGRGRGVPIRGVNTPLDISSHPTPTVRSFNVPLNADTSTSTNICRPSSSEAASTSTTTSTTTSTVRSGTGNENVCLSSLCAPAPKLNQLVDDFFGPEVDTTSVSEGDNMMIMDIDEMPSAPALVPSRPATASPAFADSAGKPRVDEQLEVVNGITRFKPKAVKKELTYLSGSRWA
ncbi:hypothetical protein BGZ60DRAFT_23164 [Tricladium varicosporioides]|nr:hypothetical protein BGZ60DRAFT_23164 [Hymenoscyphus varicosporioides]